jgi:hypothetical protein
LGDFLKKIILLSLLSLFFLFDAQAADGDRVIEIQRFSCFIVGIVHGISQERIDFEISDIKKRKLIESGVSLGAQLRLKDEVFALSIVQGECLNWSDFHTRLNKVFLMKNEKVEYSDIAAIIKDL